LADERKFYEVITDENCKVVSDWFRSLGDDEKAKIFSKFKTCCDSNYVGKGFKALGNTHREIKTLKPNPGLRIICCPHPTEENSWIMIHGFKKPAKKSQPE
jgi:hypothetical protein